MAVSLVLAATVSYLASCGFGALAASGRVGTNRVRWLHHALFVSTVCLTAFAASGVFWAAVPSTWVLLPALVPLALIPFFDSRSRTHILLASVAAPFYTLAAILLLWR